MQYVWVVRELVASEGWAALVTGAGEAVSAWSAAAAVGWGRSMSWCFLRRYSAMRTASARLGLW